METIWRIVTLDGNIIECTDIEYLLVYLTNCSDLIKKIEKIEDIDCYKIEYHTEQGEPELLSANVCAKSVNEAVKKIKDFIKITFGGGTIVHVWKVVPYEEWEEK